MKVLLWLSHQFGYDEVAANVAPRNVIRGINDSNAHNTCKVGLLSGVGRKSFSAFSAVVVVAEDLLIVTDFVTEDGSIGPVDPDCKLRDQSGNMLRFGLRLGLVPNTISWVI